MPELPEAETIVRGLRTTVVGKTIARAEVLKPDILREPKRRFTPRVRGRSIRSVTRRAKNVVVLTGAGLAISVLRREILEIVATPTYADSAPPLNGISPVSISNSTTPRDQTSARSSVSWPRTCSGDM